MGQLQFPEAQLTAVECEAVNARPPQTSAAQSVESLTHQLVSNIIEEVTRRGSCEQVTVDPAETTHTSPDHINIRY